MTVPKSGEAGADIILLKFGCFFFTKEGEEFEHAGSTSAERISHANYKALLQGAMASPLVTNIVDEGMDEANWATPVVADDRMGVASGLLSEIVFEARWPSRNWSGLEREQPEQLLIALNGLFYAVIASVPHAPYEDSFELGRQTQNCLRAIYASMPGFFIESIGPTPMWPAIYVIKDSDGRDSNSIAMIGEQDLLVRDALMEPKQVALKMVSESAWAISEHYLGLQERSELIRKDSELDAALGELFELSRQYSEASGMSPRAILQRRRTKQELHRKLSSVYETHSKAMKLKSTLKRYPKESSESFESLPHLAPFSNYTYKTLENMLDWDDSYVMQCTKFVEDELRSRSLEQITLTAALAGGFSGALVGGVLSLI